MFPDTKQERQEGEKEERTPTLKLKEKKKTDFQKRVIKEKKERKKRKQPTCFFFPFSRERQEGFEIERIGNGVGGNWVIHTKKTKGYFFLFFSFLNLFVCHVLSCGYIL